MIFVKITANAEKVLKAGIKTIEKIFSLW